MKAIVAIAVYILAWAVVSAHGQTDVAGLGYARIEGGGRTFNVVAAGLTRFRSGFSATVEVGGVRRVLNSNSGTLIGTNVYHPQKSAYGMNTGTLSTIRFVDEQIDLLFRLDQFSELPVVTLNVGIRNFGTLPVRLVEVAPIAMDETNLPGQPSDDSLLIQVSGSLGAWTLTGLHRMTPVLSLLSEVTAPLEIYEYGGFYRHDGAGFLFGPVGDPVTYVSTRVTQLANGTTALTLTADMNGVRVDPDQIRWGQQVGLFMEPPRNALVRWTEWVARTHGARLSKGALCGWNSWYSLGSKVTGADVLKVVGQVSTAGGHLRPDVVEIDRGYELSLGSPMETNLKFSEGLSFYAKSIEAIGARPGIKLRLGKDYSSVSDYLDVLRSAVNKGFTYLKLDRCTSGFTPGGSKTLFEVVRENGMRARKVVGPNTYLLSSDVVPDRALVGVIDASRTGAQTVREGVRPVMEDVLRSYQFNGRWYAVDNDCYYMATELKDVSPVVGGWPLARTWISMVGLSCGAAITSDPWYEERFRAYWRNVEVLTPVAKEQTEVLDLCTSREWSRLVGHVSREWGNWTVALLWNPAEREQTVRLDFDRIGLDPKRRYAVWSFWDNRFLGVTEGGWTTPFLAPSASQHLSFTELPQSSGKPVLIGSNLHIYCGAAEIKRVTSLDSAMQIELTDAGARDGDLFIYNHIQPEVKDFVGCTADQIRAAGENVWRLPLRNRIHGAVQRVDLSIPLPLTRQSWFWALLSMLAASLLLAGWRYEASLRFERLNALEQERRRIARDIHDDLGTSLTRVSAMADSGSAVEKDQASLRSDLAAIRAMSQEMTRSMDEIVWAINPQNDTLESMVNYISEYAGEFLAPTGLRLRLDMPMQLPAVSMSADIRHNLLLAFREALNNIVKHAAAREVQVTLKIEPRQLRLAIHDDGRGIHSEPGSLPHGNGLLNMRNRMMQLKGECNISNSPERGTTVEFVLPFKPLKS
jgi:signal transduction histidine kinase